MLSTLKIENFQSHEKTDLEFCSGVNVIEGRSQSGKTAVLRAFQWLVNNRPRGFRFHSYFADKNPTRVSLKLSDSPDFVSIEKTNKDATYSAGDHEFKGFSADVPDKIKELLNLNEINIQNQLERPFLITDSPGEIARTINQITRLEKVDQWVRSLTSKINKLNHERDIVNDQIKEWENQLEKYEGLDLVAEWLDELDEIELSIVGTIEAIREISGWVGYIARLEQKLRMLGKIGRIEKLVDQAENISQEMKEASILISLLNEFIETEKQLNSVVAIVSDLEEIETILLEEEEYKTFKDLFDDLDDLDWKLSEVEGQYRELKDRYVKLFTDLGKCPFCFSEISKEKARELVGEL